MLLMNCVRCGNPLTGNQTKYCSPKCCKLWLKKLYRVRRRDHILEYNRHYKSLGLRPPSKEKRHKRIEDFNGECLRCGATEELNVHHIKPLRLGGNNEPKNLIVLCFQCHQKYHQYFDHNFWQGDKPAPRTKNIISPAFLERRDASVINKIPMSLPIITDKSLMDVEIKSYIPPLHKRTRARSIS